MSALTWAAVLAGSSLVSIVLLKSYWAVSLKEQKRRARRGDVYAAKMYKAAAYGTNLRLLLWVFAGGLTGALFLIIAQNTAAPVGLGSIALFIWIGFGWLLHSRASSFGMWLAGMLGPPLGWLAGRIQPIMQPFTRLLSRYFHSSQAGLYEKEDLIDLISRQKKQTHNHISKEELSIAANALQFGDKLVADVLVPRRSVKLVNATDSVGPVLLDELHKSGHSRFPVYDGKKDNLVGMLYLHDLVESRGGGQVKNFMKPKLYFVKEDQPLGHVLDAFIKTKHHLFIVVNNFEEMVGIISMEDILEQILGKPILDEFDRYEDLRAVAAIGAEKDAEEHKETQEVVE
jgi:CBS domain containing-hemolysin-like protein